jgi:hypothetical protein
LHEVKQSFDHTVFTFTTPMPNWRLAGNLSAQSPFFTWQSLSRQVLP